MGRSEIIHLSVFGLHRPNMRHMLSTLSVSGLLAGPNKPPGLFIIGVPASWLNIKSKIEDLHSTYSTFWKDQIHIFQD